MLLAADGVAHVAEDLGISPQQKRALLKLAHESPASGAVWTAGKN
jgi:hypothetical protein